MIFFFKYFIIKKNTTDELILLQKKKNLLDGIGINVLNFRKKFVITINLIFLVKNWEKKS